MVNGIPGIWVEGAGGRVVLSVSSMAVRCADGPTRMVNPWHAPGWARVGVWREGWHPEASQHQMQFQGKWRGAGLTSSSPAAGHETSE